LRDEDIWSLYDQSDPSKGVSLKYIGSPDYMCHSGDIERTLTIDVMCGDKSPYIIEYAQEPDVCQYHIQMTSIQGCPKECLVTSNGLCDGHGECSYDSTSKSPHCFCYEGRGGKDCTDEVSISSSGSSGSSSSSSGVQVTLIIIMLVVTLVLVGVVVFMIRQVQQYRQEQFVSGSYSSLMEAEMTTMEEF